jgi:hypothetical protein
MILAPDAGDFGRVYVCEFRAVTAADVERFAIGRKHDCVWPMFAPTIEKT